MFSLDVMPGGVLVSMCCHCLLIGQHQVIVCTNDIRSMLCQSQIASLGADSLHIGEVDIK